MLPNMQFFDSKYSKPSLENESSEKTILLKQIRILDISSSAPPNNFFKAVCV
jgi:hypothetical protein